MRTIKALMTFGVDEDRDLFWLAPGQSEAVGMVRYYGPGQQANGGYVNIETLANVLGATIVSEPTAPVESSLMASRVEALELAVRVYRTYAGSPTPPPAADVIVLADMLRRYIETGEIVR